MAIWQRRLAELNVREDYFSYQIHLQLAIICKSDFEQVLNLARYEVAPAKYDKRHKWRLPAGHFGPK